MQKCASYTTDLAHLPVYLSYESNETAFGKPLSWQRLDNKQGCRVCYVVKDGGLLNREKWPEIQKQMIDSMIELQKAIQPVINQVSQMEGARK